MKLFSFFKNRYYTSLRFIYPDDVFLVSYPRSGNTWIRYILAHLLAPYEVIDRNRTLYPDIYVPINWQKVTMPRMIKSHEPFTKEYPKIIYLMRDGRDVACSYYNFYCRNRGNQHPLSFFLKEFLKPTFDFGS